MINFLAGKTTVFKARWRAQTKTPKRERQTRAKRVEKFDDFLQKRKQSNDYEQ